VVPAAPAALVALVALVAPVALMAAPEGLRAAWAPRKPLWLCWRTAS
jgi:hypothetical protein